MAVSALPRRPLGDTGLMVSPLGLGTVKFGRNQQVKYPTAFDLPDDRQVRELLALAMDLGINLLDTAPAYGSAEERLGQLRPGRREDWVIVGKVGECFEAGRSRFDFSAAATRATVEASLKRLRTDYLDAVLIHSDGDDRRILLEEEVAGTLADLKREGLIRATGISSKTVDGGLLALDCCDMVMVTYNPRDTAEAEVIRTAHARNKGVLIKKGLLSGHIGQVPGADPVEACLRFIFAEAGVGSVIVGTINAGHLRQNVEAMGRVLAGI